MPAGGAAFTVGRDHAGDGGDDGLHTKLLDEVLESQHIGVATNFVPNVTRLVVVKSDTVARAKQLIEAVVQALVLVGRVRGAGQVLGRLQDDN